jgi:hypothetical protein
MGHPFTETSKANVKNINPFVFSPCNAFIFYTLETTGVYLIEIDNRNQGCLERKKKYGKGKREKI